MYASAIEMKYHHHYLFSSTAVGVSFHRLLSAIDINPRLISMISSAIDYA